jgi:hypothetical protein
LALSHISTNGADVKALLDELAPILTDKDSGLVLMTSLSIAFLVQDPDISAEKLVDGIKAASEFIALYLSEAPELEDDSQHRMN